MKLRWAEDVEGGAYGSCGTYLRHSSCKAHTLHRRSLYSIRVIGWTAKRAGTKKVALGALMRPNLSARVPQLFCHSSPLPRGEEIIKLLREHLLSSPSH